MQESGINMFYQQGLSYLINGVQKCFSSLEECDLDYQEDHKKVAKIAQQIKGKVDFLCSSHLEAEYKQDENHQEYFDALKKVNKKLTAQLERAEESLGRERRRRRKMMRVNFGLKKKNRNLKKRLKKAQNLNWIVVSQPVCDAEAPQEELLHHDPGTTQVEGKTV